MLILLLLIGCSRTGHNAAEEVTALRALFESPPNSAQPRVWWHWMNGNISKQGIRKDLEWMHRTGIGGFQNFDANLFTPVVVPRKLVFMDTDWKDAFKFTTELADSLGLEMAIAGSPGWSVTGGPWVEPRDGMKKYVWTERIVEGGQAFDGRLPEPPHTTGAFQNTPVPSEGIAGDELETLPEYYHDAAVVAFKLAEKPTSMADLQPGVTSSAGHFNIEMLTDSNLEASIYLPPAAVGENMWIQYEFITPQTFRSYAVTGAYHNSLEQFRGSPDNRALLVSDDGRNFRKVTDIPGTLVPQTTGSFPETTAKYWRFAIETLPPGPRGFSAMFGAPASTDPDGIEVAEFNLFAMPRINLFEQKAGFAAWRERPLPDGDSGTAGIALENVVDLTEKCDENGNLKWTVPDGSWKIIRLGYSLTGRQNHPASPEATGLEVDKLDEEAVRRYINTYLDMYKDATGGRMGAEGLGYVILDSYEAGHMNWTHDMVSEFSSRRGYDMKPWVPVLAGYVIKDVQQSEKFLWDFRKTIGEMIAENHYDVIGEELHKRGMKRYTESHEGGRIYLADGMDVKRNADIPMSAMWTPGSLAGGADEEVRSEADIRESASVANIYGQPYVAAESMTSVGRPFQEYPGRLKRTADMELASGLNRYVIHTSVHQPLDDKMPGFSLGPFGQYFTRQETWAEQAIPWIDYLSRGSLMMQQGQNVADVLYFYGENTNITQLCTEKLPQVPAGYEYDFVNSSALMNAIEFHDGNLVAASGNTYKLLVLDASAQEMTLPVLKKINTLVLDGARVYGAKPLKSPSRSDDPDAFLTLADETWAHPNVLQGNLKDALAGMQIPPDVIFEKTAIEIRYRHRQTKGLDIYWLNNRSEDPTSVEISFRISGREPELWNPQTGETRKVSYRMEGGRTLIPLKFESWDAYFIVFGADTDTEVFTLPESMEAEIATLTGPWVVSFQEERGAPEAAVLDSLTTLSALEDPGIRYFSGTVTYRKSIEMGALPEGEKVVLDLGEVHNLAEIKVNGQELGVAWKAPFRIDITPALKQGENTIEIAVTNAWVNRLIGDAQPGVKDKITFTALPFYSADSPLVPSGLVGPVKIIGIK